MYRNITETTSFSRLNALASAPFDLTGKGALYTDDRLGRYVCRHGLMSLHYGTQRVDDEVLSALQELADELQLVDQFKAMRRGKVLNRIEGVESENRQVLHTACRDLFTDTPAESGSSWSAAEELKKLREFLNKVDSGEIANAKGQSFTTMIHVGIGGSDLGPRAIYEALKPFGQTGRKVYYISNVDPDDAAAVLAQVELPRALVNIVSKSGTTLETLSNEEIVVAAFEREGLNPANHFLAVTGQGSPMDNPEKYLCSFYMYDYIGGRFSATSMVGAVSLGFYLGLDQVFQFLRGASAIDTHAEREDLRSNIPLLLALLGIWNRNFLAYPSLAVLPYSQALHRFPAHLQQCDMESNGKSLQRSGKKTDCPTGPLIWGEPGTNGQHAFYQLLHQGTEIIPCEFIGFKESQFDKDLEVRGSSSQLKLLSNLYAQMTALAIGKGSENPNRHFNGNRPSSLLLGNRLTPETMGALLAIYEAKIVFQGFAWNINSFDQEGVQLGKVLATRFLDEMEDKKSVEDSLEKYFLKQL
jgi:glucose-6-phosphate isomerase